MRDLRAQKTIRSSAEQSVHMNSFKLDLSKVSIGIWCLNPGGSRFHEAYVPSKTIKERLSMAQDLAGLGISALEAHFPSEVNMDNLDLYLDLQKKTGIRLVGIPFSHFYDKDFEFGGLSNPNESIRKKAKEITIEGLQMVQKSGAECAISWPGIDGYTYSYGNDYFSMWERFERAMAEAIDSVPGVRIAIEPKPYEPAPNNIYRTTAEGLLAARRIEQRLTNPVNKALIAEGHALVALNPEIGHVRMGYENCAHAYSLCALEGRLAHVHLNSQPLGNYDQDLNVGVVEWHEAESLLYALKMCGYQEYFGLDVYPERMPPLKAVEINMTVLKRMNERIERLPHAKISDCFSKPSENRGEYELIMAKNML
ncbi:MAG: xylose isomerase [Fibrobacteres bacterium]|nr:xylose isomerase [Fibrobacterota bacterium]